MGFKQIGIFVPWLKLKTIIAGGLNIQIVLIMEIIYVLGDMSVFLQYFFAGGRYPLPHAWGGGGGKLGGGKKKKKKKNWGGRGRGIFKIQYTVYSIQYTVRSR